MSEPKDILIANDEDDIARIVSDRLEFQGYALRRARDGRECLELVAQQVPDLLLLDIRMPELDGVQVLERLQRSHPDLPIIVVSASADQQLMAECLERGAVDYLIKPFEGATLQKKVAAVLEAS